MAGGGGVFVSLNTWLCTILDCVGVDDGRGACMYNGWSGGVGTVCLNT